MDEATSIFSIITEKLKNEACKVLQEIVSAQYEGVNKPTALLVIQNLALSRNSEKNSSSETSTVGSDEPKRRSNNVYPYRWRF